MWWWRRSLSRTRDGPACCPPHTGRWLLLLEGRGGRGERLEWWNKALGLWPAKEEEERPKIHYATTCDETPVATTTVNHRALRSRARLKTRLEIRPSRAADTLRPILPAAVDCCVDGRAPSASLVDLFRHAYSVCPLARAHSPPRVCPPDVGRYTHSPSSCRSSS